MIKARSTLSKKWIAIIGVNLLVLFVTAEIAGVAYHYYQHGTLYYTHKPQYETATNITQEPSVQRRLHPYFGFLDNIPGTVSPNSTLTANNYGFLSEQGDYPFTKKNDQFVIGIFGGSVSHQIFKRGRMHLIKTLKQHEFFADKEIIILAFGQAGYKQPQQLLVLNYFLSIGQELDMVINIDGFNEVVLSEANYHRGTEISLPNEGHMLLLLEIVQQSTLSSEKFQTIAEIDRRQSQLDKIAKIINSNRLASVNFVLEQYYAIQYNRYQHTISAYQALPVAASENSLMVINQARPVPNQEVLYRQIAAHWADSSILMHQLLLARGIPYFHFLQANQYHTGRKFSAEEAQIALNGQHPYRRAATDGYPYLLAEAERLHNNKVNFYSTIHVFDQVEGIVYADDCCHYSSLGIEIITDFMTRAILGSEAFDQVIRISQSGN